MEQYPSMDSFFVQWLTLFTVFGAVVISPGPDFMICLRYSLAYGRRAGMFTALGFGLGLCVHITYTLIGVAALIAHSPILFTSVQMLGAAYLFYIGVRALRSTGWADTTHPHAGRPHHKADFPALRDGFLTNLFNPKAGLFFLALFTQILRPDNTALEQFIFGLTIVSMSVTWFIGVAAFMTIPRVRAVFARYSMWMDRLCGVIFLGLAVKLVTNLIWR